MSRRYPVNRKPHKGGKALWRPKFRSFDGEGYNADEDGKDHRYFLLACSNGEYVSDAQGLSTAVCFDFIARCHAMDPHYLCVCFGASYDVNQMLRDVPKDRLKTLWETGVCWWRDWRIAHTPRKLLQVTHYINKVKDYSWTLYDVFGFFQASFVTTVEEWLGRDYEDLPQIRAGKSRRSQFSLDELPEILSYCRAELRTLDVLMYRLADYLRQAKIHIGQWHGAGAIASRLLQDHRTKEHMQRTIEDWPGVYQAARYAFFGGRIELLQYGYYDGELYHYDLNSAYPSAIRLLPSLADATWHYRQVERWEGWTTKAGKFRHLPTRWQGPLPEFALCHVVWKSDGDAPFYPFPYRTAQGTVYFPPAGEGWYWTPEVEAARELFGGQVRVLEYWTPRTEGPAFDWVEPLYELRRQYKAENNPVHVVLKLGLNSLYGKLVQHVGGNQGERKLPAFHQLEWAGYITSYARAKLYRAAMQRPSAIVSFQTDAIISTEPLDLDRGSRLGQWSEEDTAHAGIFVQSGVYFLCESHKGVRDFYRGFDPNTLSGGRILKAWREHTTGVSANSTRFVTLGSALTSERGWEDWRTFRTVERTLALGPAGTKRMESGSTGSPEKGLVKTAASIQFLQDGASHPYSLPWDQWGWDTPETRIDGIPAGLYLAEADDALV